MIGKTKLLKRVRSIEDHIETMANVIAQCAQDDLPSFSPPTKTSWPKTRPENAPAGLRSEISANDVKTAASSRTSILAETNQPSSAANLGDAVAGGACDPSALIITPTTSDSDD